MARKQTDEGLGERLRRFRTDKGLSQAELARAAQLSPAYLSELEGGAGKRPSGRVLLALGDALGVTIADLLGRRIAPESEPALPPSLVEFAKRRGIPDGDVKMLASIRFRGDPLRSERRWEMIYDTIRTSRGLDEEG